MARKPRCPKCKKTETMDTDCNGNPRCEVCDPPCPCCAQPGYPDDDERCYYGEEFCTQELWECETCHELYCDQHGHQTSKGTNVECVACENNRKETEPERNPAYNGPHGVFDGYGDCDQDPDTAQEEE